MPSEARKCYFRDPIFQNPPGEQAPGPLTRALVIGPPNKSTFAMVLCSLYELHLSKYVRNFSHNMGLNISGKKEIACNY